MLILTRRVGETIKIGEDIEVTTAAKQTGCMWYRTGWDDGFNAGLRAARKRTGNTDSGVK